MFAPKPDVTADELGAPGRYPLKPSIRSYAEHMRRLVVERTEGPAAAARTHLLTQQTRNGRG
jgi:hypothetical protein